MQDLLDALDAVGSGAACSPVESVVPLDAATAAMRVVAGGATLGRQVLLVGPEAEALAA